MLSHATLSDAFLSDANLSQADLGGVDLNFAQNWTDGQLEEASLEGATMPNGQKYADCLQDNEGREEDSENSGP